MQKSNFQISKNRTDYCFNPLTCPTDNGHLVVWGYGVDTEPTLWGSVFVNKKLIKKVEIGLLKQTDNILYFRKFSNELYVVAIETINGTNLYFFNENIETVITQQLSKKFYYELLHLYQKDNDIYLFNYDYNEQTLYLSVVKNDKIWDEAQIIQCYTNVCSLPTIQIFTNKFVIGWINDDDTLKIISSNLTIDLLPAELEMDNYNVDYLCSAKADKDLIVFGGYNNESNKFRLDFYRITDSSFTFICSKYRKSDEYTNLSFSLESLHKGFVILADGPKNKGVYIQRFTHIGSWLYPLMNVCKSNEECWSPSLSENINSTLIVYVKHYDEGFSNICGRWIETGPIPELDNLSLEDF